MNIYTHLSEKKIDEGAAKLNAFFASKNPMPNPEIKNNIINI